MTITAKLHLIDQMTKRNNERVAKSAGVATKIIYNKYSVGGAFVGEREYMPHDTADYDRVMAIIEQNPDEYELVNCEYGFAFVG